MPIILPTIEGKEIQAGYAWGDLEQIHLDEGRIPPLTTSQFLGFATTVLCDLVIPNLPGGLRQEWKEEYARIRTKVNELPDRPRSDRYFGVDKQTILNDFDMAMAGTPEDRTLYYDGLNMAKRLDQAEYRTENPFDVSADGQVVGLKNKGAIAHSIESPYFVDLTAYALTGGRAYGWGEAGTYPEVRMAANLLHNAFQEATGASA